jgi:cytochrome c556
VQRNADYLAALADAVGMASMRAPRARKSRAPPAIWEQPGKVKEAIDRFQSEVGKLQQVSKGGDEGAIKAQIGAVGKACAGCHDNFREKQ